MDQLTQKLNSGEMVVQELPVPQIGPGAVLVRNHYSLISAGTEASTVKAARKGLIGKAKERPEQVKQVLNMLKQQGPVQTYRAVMKKLDAYSPLGCSSAGVVMEVGEGVHGFSVGDRVACAGAGYANHAEVVCVPTNLCVKLPEDADLKRACYNTLGAIALQGIRQADLRLGESCAVIGLGLLGQLTCLMLRAGGIRAFGIDIDPSAVETAAKHCADRAWARSAPGLADQIDSVTGGLGVDAVIITAATTSLDPVNLAGRLARKKGRVVVVGVVPTGFDRDTYYRKELELRMSCSYGPGRYDLDYEEKGADYPAAYVRWTENRNMQAFQEMVYSGRINLDYLTTHTVHLEDAPRAYDMIVGRTEPFLGVVIEYDVEKPVERRRITVQHSRPGGRLGVAFIGAGSYAQGNLLPNLPRNDRDVVLRGVMTNSGTTSKRVAERFGFEFCTDSEAEVLEREEIDTVFIATRHDSHARYVLKALGAGKHVFVEKPLCLTLGELQQIETAYAARPDRQLMIGFNRRFAPLATMLKERLGDGPLAAIYRVNAGAIPRDTWIQDPEIGGGRILGEACHFIDFLTFLSGALPTSVHAAALPEPQGLSDTVSITLTFANGSVGTVCYFANGSRELPKEYVEVYQSGLTGVLRDFKSLELYGDGKPTHKKLFNQNKGQAVMVRQFLERIKSGSKALITPEEIFAVTRATFAAGESTRTRNVIQLLSCGQGAAER